MIKVPIISEPVLKQFLSQNKEMVYSLIVDEIELAISEEKEYVEFCRFGSSHFCAGIPAKNYVVALDAAMTYFVEMELYEEAARCKNLLMNIIIDDVTKWNDNNETT